MIHDEFKTLAAEFWKTELWKHLTDSDIFGVELADGEIAYCCVMGSKSVHCGLGVYVGNRGYRSYLDTIAMDLVRDEKNKFNIMATFECMQVIFADDGKVEWWVQHPYQVAEPENATAEELYILCQALRVCIDLRLLIDAKDGDVVSLGFDESEEYPTREGGKEALLMKAEESGGYACSIIHLPAYYNTYEEQLKQAADDVVRSGYIFSSMAALRGLSKTGKLQCRLITLPAPIRESDDVPGFYPLWLLTVNNSDGQIVQTKAHSSVDDSWISNILSDLCASMHWMGRLPQQIVVPDNATECLLASFCQSLGIRLSRDRRLRDLDEAWENLFNYFERNH